MDNKDIIRSVEIPAVTKNGRPMILTVGNHYDGRLRYDFGYKGENPLFFGGDFRPSPCYGKTSNQSLADLLSFLTLREGDTDREHFDRYNNTQLEWCRSLDCKVLAGDIFMHEESGTLHELFQEHDF